MYIYMACVYVCVCIYVYIYVDRHLQHEPSSHARERAIPFHKRNM